MIFKYISWFMSGLFYPWHQLWNLFENQIFDTMLYDRHFCRNQWVKGRWVKRCDFQIYFMAYMSGLFYPWYNHEIYLKIKSFIQCYMTDTFAGIKELMRCYLSSCPLDHWKLHEDLMRSRELVKWDKNIPHKRDLYSLIQEWHLQC